MRLFVALQITEELRARFAALIGAFREMTPPLKWVGAENLHVTLKFIGHIADDRLPAIQTALAGVRAAQPMELRFRGLGFFPNEKRPRVFWLGIEAPPALPQLAAGIDNALYSLGIPLETRPFSPHLTLARADESHRRLPDAFRTAVTQRAAQDLGALDTDAFHLVQSKLKPGGAEYTTLRSFRFTGAS